MILRKIARPLLASAFVASGAQLLRAPAPIVESVQPMVDTGHAALPAGVASKVPADAATAMRAAGAVQIGGGLLLATGRFPRVASSVLAASLVPVTVYDTAFWTENDPVRREARKVGLVKNLGLLGGVLIASADTAGQPSLAWRTRRAAEDAERAVAKELRTAENTGKRAMKRAARKAAKHSLVAQGHPLTALAVPLAAKAGAAAVGRVEHHADADLHQLGERAAVAADKAKGAADKAKGKAKAAAESAAATVADRAPVLMDEAKTRAEALAGTAAEQAPVLAAQAREQAVETGQKVARRVRKAQAKAAAALEKAVAEQ